MSKITKKSKKKKNCHKPFVVWIMCMGCTLVVRKAKLEIYLNPRLKNYKLNIFWSSFKNK